MNMIELIHTLKSRPDFDRAGMILCHEGVVRGTARDGRKVTGLRVAVDHAALDALLKAKRQLPGVLDIQIRIAEERDLQVGDTVMLLAVAGDIRENVIRALEETLNDIKTTVTRKTEFFLDDR